MKSKRLNRLFISALCLSITITCASLNAADKPELAGPVYSKDEILTKNPASGIQLDVNAGEGNPSRIYTKEDVVGMGGAVDLEVDETVSIKGFGDVTRCLVVSSEIAAAIAISNKEILIRGVKVGSTFAHIWDGGNIMTVRLTVTYKGFELSQKVEKEIKRRALGEPVRVGYSYNLINPQSWSKNPPYAWKTRNEVHSYSVSGDTPYGFLSSRLDYVYKKDQIGLANDTQYANIELKNKFFDVAAGDISTSFSEITLPYTHYQGFRFYSGSAIENFKYDLVAGSTGYYQWGHKLSTFGQLKNKFYGMRSEIFPQKDVSFFATYMGSPHETDGASGQLASVGGTYKIDKYLKFEIEGGTDDDERGALVSSLKLNIGKMSSSTTYRDISVDYLNLTGNAAYRGRRGIYNILSFNPNDDIALSYSFDSYEDRLNPDPDHVNRGNIDTTFSSRFYLPPTNTSFLFSMYHRNERGQAFPFLSFGQSYEVDQTLKDVFLLGTINGFARYEPARYKSYISGESSYLDKSLTLGVKVSPMRDLTLFLQEIFNFRDWPVREYSTAPSRFEGRMTYNFDVWKMPVSLYIGGQIDSHVNKDKISTILGEDKLIGGIRLMYNISPYLNAFFNADLQNVWGSEDWALDRFESDISWGLRGDLDTQMVWQGWGTVKGRVFKDLDRNGVMDKTDIPMEGVRVLCDRKRGKTDRKGVYRIKMVKTGEKAVTLDIGTIPKNYTTTTPVSADIELENMGIAQADFGVAPKTAITGFAFNDLDRDKKFDRSSDEALPNVLFVLDSGGKAFSDAYGKFVIHNVIPGERTLTVDDNTIPKGLLIDGPKTIRMPLEEGQVQDTTFIFYALRAISGRVYIDRNENGRFDDGEGAGGVGISCANASTKTDKNGYYILRNLPAGKVYMAIDRTSLPEGYGAEKEAMSLDLKKETDIREGVDMRLIQRPSSPE